MDVAAIDPETFDLSVKNPNGGEEIAHRRLAEIMEEMGRGDADLAERTQSSSLRDLRASA